MRLQETYDFIANLWSLGHDDLGTVNSTDKKELASYLIKESDELLSDIMFQQDFKELMSEVVLNGYDTEALRTLLTQAVLSKRETLIDEYFDYASKDGFYPSRIDLKANNEADSWRESNI